MQITTPPRKLWPSLSIAFAIACIVLSASPAHADLAVISRDSSISLDSTNFGGLQQSSSTNSLSDTFNQILSGSDVHEVPGGGINTGNWVVGQLSTIDHVLIAAEGETETDVSGNGIGILTGVNEFEIEFQNIGTTHFLLSGTHEGTPSPGANDEIEVTLSQFDGVAFQTLFSTKAGGDLNANSFSGTFNDGDIYRFKILSRADVQGNETNRSAYNVTLAMNTVPEPSALLVLGVVVTALTMKRQRRPQIGSTVGN